MSKATKYRQRVVDEYLNQSGANMFVPGEFLDWLGERPDHECYSLFYGKTDEEAARQFRLGLVRSWASGLRIVVKTEPAKASKVKVSEQVVPGLISPVANRSHGGGYIQVEVKNKDSMSELFNQAGSDLESWLKRYEGTAALAQVDISAIKKIAGKLIAASVVPAE